MADTAEVVLFLLFGFLTWANRNLQIYAISPPSPTSCQFWIHSGVTFILSQLWILMIYWGPQCTVTSTHFKHKVPIPSASMKSPSFKAAFVSLNFLCYYKCSNCELLNKILLRVTVVVFLHSFICFTLIYKISSCLWGKKVWSQNDITFIFYTKT